MELTSTERQLAAFEGAWRLRKQITPSEGPKVQFDGKAQLTPVDTGLAYLETGTLRIGAGPPMEASRRYTWTRDFDVLFEDGRFFHTIPFEGQTAEHWCDPDMYRVQYDFARWPCFVVTWNVSGPRKAYTSVCTYERTGSEPL